MERFEKQAIAYTSACHGLVHILEVTYGVILVSIAQEFGASFFVLGVLANILGFAFGATALPAGFLTDRFGERRLLILCCLGMGVAAIAVGLSPSIYMLGAALAVLGLALGIYHPTGAAFIARVATQRGLAFGYLGVAGNIGLALGPLLAGVIASFMGWRAAYFIFAIPAFFLAAMFFFSARTEANFTQQSTTETGAERSSLRPVIVPLGLIFCASILNGFIYRGTVTFLPLYLSQQIHLTFLNLDSVLIAGSFTTIALIFGIGGQFLGGYLLERRRHESLVFATALVVVPLLVVVGNSAGLVLMIAASAFAFFYFMGQPIYNCLIADYSPTDWRGRVYGISFFCAFGLGSFSASILGYVADRLGTNWVFMVAAGFGLLVLICTIALLVRALKVSGYNKIGAE
ncbi:MAG: MFS transporter [Dehalococcoidales bacterium]|nr:MFS transporter [Dehalococcoidales bacterium]